MAISFTSLLEDFSDSNLDTYTTGAVSFTSGKPVILLVAVRRSGATGITSVTSTSFTFTERVGYNEAGSLMYVGIWTVTPGSTASETVAIDTSGSGSNALACTWHFLEVDGAAATFWGDTDTATATVSFNVTNSGLTIGAGNGAVAICAQNTSGDPALSIESGWAAGTDQNADAIDSITARRTDNTDATLTFTTDTNTDRLMMALMEVIAASGGAAGPGGYYQYYSSTVTGVIG